MQQGRKAVQVGIDHDAENGHDQCRLASIHAMKRHVSLDNSEKKPGDRWERLGPLGPDRASGRVIRLEQDQELNHLNSMIEDLQASLDETNKRLNRLLGERKQLTRLLDKRDDQIQRLNRALGPWVPGRIASAPEINKTISWRDVLGSTLEAIVARKKALPWRRSQAMGAATAAATETVVSKTERAPLVADHKSGVLRPILAVVMFGLDQDEIGHLLPVIERDCSSKEMMPLCLTDHDAFEQLRERGIIFEYLPPASDRNRFNPKLRWDLYIQRRLALIRRKWQPVRIVAFGAVGTDVLKLWCDSPFEETPLPAVVSR